MIKVSKGRCPKALDEFADFSVLCLVGRFTYAFCCQFSMIFCFGIFPLDRTDFFTFIIPGSRDIVQVVQTVQIDLQKVHFTEPGSNLAFVPQKHRAQLFQDEKGHVIAFYKKNTANYFITFLFWLSIFQHETETLALGNLLYVYSLLYT